MIRRQGSQGATGILSGSGTSAGVYADGGCAIPRGDDLLRIQDHSLLESCLLYHLRCAREVASDSAMNPVEWLALVRDGATRIWEIRDELEATGRAARQSPLPV